MRGGWKPSSSVRVPHRPDRRVDGPLVAWRRGSDKSGKETYSNGDLGYATVRPRPLLLTPPLLSRGRALTDDFHQHQHSAAEHRTRSVCLGIPLATCTLPVGVCYRTYLLTYL